MKIINKDSFYKQQQKLINDKKTNKNVRILVGLGTCGIAAGANKVYEALEEGIKSGELKGGELVKVGCVGYCHAEPTVELLFTDGNSVLLGNIHAESAAEVVSGYIVSVKKHGKHVLEKNIKKIMEV